jgi:hypothetical protein
MIIKEEEKKARLRVNAKKWYKKNKKSKKQYYRDNKEKILAYQKEKWRRIKESLNSNSK